MQALQARFGADKRFRLDERFAPEQDERPAEEEEGVRQEHAQQLDILGDVLGHAVGKEDGRKKRTGAAGPVRYDPSLAEHQQYQLTGKQKTQFPEPEPTAGSSAAKARPEVGGETYSVQPALSDLFGGRSSGGDSGGGFSLLQMLGREAADDLPVGASREYSTSQIKPKTKSNPMETSSNPFHYDSSSSEDEAEDGSTVAPLGGGPAGWSQTRKFFLQPGDGCLNEGGDFLRGARSAEQLRELAEQRRAELVELFRAQRHSRARQQRQGQRQRTVTRTGRVLCLRL